MYPHENAFAMYVPLGSHDTERVVTILEGEIKKVKLAMLLQFAYPGAPAIYYGDEIGLEGGKDPDSRRTFPWKPKNWNHGLHTWVKKLIHLRKTSTILRQGTYLPILADNEHAILAFGRILGEESLLVIVNANHIRRQFDLPIEKLGWCDGQIVHNLLYSGEFIVSGDKVSLVIPPMSGLILQ